MISLQAVAQALQRHRLPAYSGIADRLGGYQEYQKMAELWRELFTEELPVLGGLQAAEQDLLIRINRDLFPLNDLYASYLAYDREFDDPPLVDGWHEIPFAAWGVEWEVEDFINFDTLACLMIAVIFNHVCESGHDDSERIIEWWQGHGIAPRQYTWPHDPVWAVEHLEALPQPFNALAVVYQCVRKGTGNPWFDYCDFYYDEYGSMNYGMPMFNLHDILFLATSYEAIRHWIPVRRELQNRFDEQPRRAVEDAVRHLDKLETDYQSREPAPPLVEQEWIVDEIRRYTIQQTYER
ncbi:hypothetical protein GF348_24505 [candidate division KSB3 bacterium]|nr:hypothetical protein [candidate division KSB3 bacterium]